MEQLYKNRLCGVQKKKVLDSLEITEQEKNFFRLLLDLIQPSTGNIINKNPRMKHGPLSFFLMKASIGYRPRRIFYL
jgi:hypothetical protein